MDCSQGSSLARFRKSDRRHIRCDVDVCRMIMHVCLVIKKKILFTDLLDFSKLVFLFLAFPFVLFHFILTMSSISFSSPGG